MLADALADASAPVACDVADMAPGDPGSWAQPG